jgi:phage terminase large subunit-like protein
MSLFKLREKLTRYATYRRENMLDFMQWEKYEKQHEIRKKVLNRLFTGCGKKIFVIFGGNRSGKSETGAGIVAEYLEKKTDGHVMCATVDYKTSVKVQQSKLNMLIRLASIKYAKYSPVRGYTNQTVLMKDGANCIFRSYEQGREAIQGMDLDLIWLDEECPWDFFQESLARTTDRNGVILFTFTSLSGFTRLVDFLWESDSDLIETSVLTLFDNPFISEESKKNYLMMVDGDEYESRVLGKPKVSQGLIYKEFGDINKVDRFDYVKLAKNNPRRYEIHEGIDPHERTPHHWCRFLWDKQKDILYIVEELKAPTESMIVADYCRLIKTKRAGINPVFTQIDTASMKPDVIYKHPEEDREDNMTIRYEFHRNGIETILCVKDNAVGIGAVKKRIKCVKTDSGEIKRSPRLYVFKDLTGVLWEFSRYSWDSYATSLMQDKKGMMNKVRKKDDHYMDIIKYEALKIEPEQHEEYMYNDLNNFEDIGY